MVEAVRFKNGKINTYFKLQLTVLRYFGISLDEEGPLYSIYTWNYCVVVLFIGFFVMGYDVWLNLNNSTILISELMYYLLFLLDCIKIFFVIFRRKAILGLLERLEEGIFLPNDERGGPVERELIEQGIHYTNLQCYVWWFFVSMQSIIATCVVIVRRLMYSSENWLFPLHPFLQYVPHETPWFEIVSVYQTISTVYCAFAITGIDLLIVGVITHLSIHCRILQHDIKVILGKAQRNTGKGVAEVSWKDLQKSLKNIVHYHWAVLDIAEQFEEVFNLLILSFVGGCMIIICLIMYNGLQYSPFDLKAIQNYCLIMIIAIQTFLYCYWGDEVATESAAIATACYDAYRVNSDYRYRKALLLIMARSQKPITLTAGKFVNLAYVTFFSVIKASWTYFMFLTNVNGQSPNLQHGGV